MSQYQELSKFFHIIYHTNNVISAARDIIYKDGNLYKISITRDENNNFDVQSRKIQLRETSSLLPINMTYPILGLIHIDYRHTSTIPIKMIVYNTYRNQNEKVYIISNRKR